jgi:hypothetical protein
MRGAVGRLLSVTLKTTQKRNSAPYHTSRCYACDGTACGVSDRRHAGGLVEAACKRHADASIRAFAACVFCSGARPSLVIDGDFAHRACHAEAVQS